MNPTDEVFGVVIPVWSLPTQRDMEPARIVLDEYTNAYIDAHIAGRTDAWAEAWRMLRTVPEDWRQSVWAAAHAATFQLQVDYAPGWRQQALSYFVPRPGQDLNQQIHHHVHLFHAGERPKRVEGLVSDEDGGSWTQFMLDPSRFDTHRGCSCGAPSCDDEDGGV